MGILSKALFTTVVPLSLLLAKISNEYFLSYLLGDASIAQIQEENAVWLNFMLHADMFTIHVVAGSIVLLLSPLQWIAWIRKNYINVHKRIGKIVLSASLLSSLSSFFLLSNNILGPIGGLGYFTWGCAWYYSSLQAWNTATSGKIEEHVEWSQRSYALALGAVSLRTQFVLCMFLPRNLAWSIYFVPFTCWITNLGICEYFIRRNRAFKVAQQVGSVTKIEVVEE